VKDKKATNNTWKDERRKWKDNIKMDLEIVGLEDVGLDSHGF
jgi:hypothetical protein